MDAPVAGWIEPAVDQRPNYSALMTSLSQRHFGRAPASEGDRRITIAAFCADALAVIENHHADTAHHLLRCARYAALLAKHYNSRFQVQLVSPQRLHDLSLWHDIGKLHVPLDVLDKPGKLSDQERLHIEHHAERGAYLVDAVCRVAHPAWHEGCRIARDIVLYHHERWDGGGYPYAVSRQAIPLYARIVAVADVIDALASPRSYKRARSLDDAFDYVRAESGKAFDPQVAAAMLAARDELRRASA